MRCWSGSGHPVILRVGPHDEMFPLLGQGSDRHDGGGLAAAGACSLLGPPWRGGRGGGPPVRRRTLLLGGAELRAEDEVADIADLAKPAVARRMTRQIQGIGTAATITTVSQAAVRDIWPGGPGLLRFGQECRRSGPAPTKPRSANADWFVVPTWAPQYLNRGGRLRALRTRVTCSARRTTARWWRRRHVASACPQRRGPALSKHQLGLDGVNEMDWMVNVDKLAPRDAAKAWIRANEPASRLAAESQLPPLDASYCVSPH